MNMAVNSHLLGVWDSKSVVINIIVILRVLWHRQESWRECYILCNAQTKVKCGKWQLWDLRIVRGGHQDDVMWVYRYQLCFPYSMH